MLRLTLQKLQYEEPSASFLTISGSTPETAYKACKSGSITSRTQGEVKPIMCKAGSLEAFKYELIDSIGKRIEYLRSAEEGEIIVENEVHEISFNNRTLIELLHIKNRSFFIFEIEYQKNINPTGSSSESTLSPAGPLVKRFGINPEAISKKAIIDEEYLIPTSELHLVEKEVLGFALQEIVGKPSAESSGDEGFAQNVVVVDIFARDGVKLKIDAKTNLPEIHAIVLWKKSEDRIALIDPNNQEYSQHIAKCLNLKFGEPIVDIVSMAGKILYTNQQKKTGRTEDGAPDPQPRDCIDIAVKIAFEINEQQKNSTSSGSIIREMLGRISNKKVLNDAVTYIDNTLIRELQSTDKELREQSRDFLKEKKVIIKTTAEVLKENGIDNPSFTEIKDQVPAIEIELERIKKIVQVLNNVGIKISVESKEAVRLLKENGIDNPTREQVMEQIRIIGEGSDAKVSKKASLKGKERT